jgi:hypothetical protein
VLVPPPQSNRVDREHRVDGRVHQVVPSAQSRGVFPAASPARVDLSRS